MSLELPAPLQRLQLVIVSDNVANLVKLGWNVRGWVGGLMRGMGGRFVGGAANI